MGQQNDQTQKCFLPSISFWCCILCSPKCSTPPKKERFFPLHSASVFWSRIPAVQRTVALKHAIRGFYPCVSCATPSPTRPCPIGARPGRPPAHIISTSSTSTTISTSTTTISTHFDFTDDGLYAEEGLTWWSVPTQQPIQRNCIQPKFPSLFPLCTLSSPHVTRPGHTLPNASA